MDAALTGCLPAFIGRREVTMKRRIVAFLATSALVAALAGPAQAIDYPEQPGDNNARGCEAVATAPADRTKPSDRGEANQQALFADACAGGP
jgi:hypothetical protein